MCNGCGLHTLAQEDRGNLVSSSMVGVDGSTVTSLCMRHLQLTRPPSLTRSSVLSSARIHFSSHSWSAAYNVRYDVLVCCTVLRVRHICTYGCTYALYTGSNSRFFLPLY